MPVRVPVCRCVVGAAIILVSACAVSSSRPLFADSFNWADLNGQSWVTPIRTQWDGLCWAFGSVGTLEARYKLTRNDPLFNPNLSEQQLDWETHPDLLAKGDMMITVSFELNYGVVSEAECPLGTSHTPDPLYYPLAAGWENRCWTGTGSAMFAPTATTASLKAALKAYGPMAINFNNSNDMFDSVAHLTADINSGTTSVTARCTHGVVLVGYVDDPSIACGGYWIVKNSAGTSYGDAGYGYSPYGHLEYHQYAVAIPGSAYYTGSMGTATWSGGAGTWTKNSNTKWTLSGGTYTTWQNEEILARFYAAGSTVTLSGTVIAHGLDITGSGYVFNGGSLTVTNNGISTTQNVTFNTSISVGAPQTWTIPVAKTMTVNGMVHTIVSDLTLANSGTLYLTEGIDGGGVVNSLGGAPGSILHTGTGTTYVTGGSNACTNLTVSAGTVVFSGGSLQLGGYATVASSAVFTQTGGSTSVASYLSLSGALNLNGGTLAVAALSSGAGRLNIGTATFQANAAFASNIPVALTSPDGHATIDTQDYSVTLSSGLSGAGALTKTGTGTLTLAASNSYNGSLTVAAGSLRVASSLTGSSSVTVASGASLVLVGGIAARVSLANGAALAGYGTAGSVNAAAGAIIGSDSDASTWGGTLSITYLNLAGDSYFHLGNISGYTSTAGIKMLGANTFASSGTIHVGLHGTFSGTGTGAARLFQYSGSVTGSLSYTLDAVDFAIQRSTYTLGTSSSSGITYLNLNYSIEYPYWTGAGDHVWTTAAQTTKNWRLISAGSETDYLNNDTVLFDNRVGGSSATVTLGENVAPATVLFANSSAVSYTVTGGTAGYCIGGSASLTVGGNGSVTLLTNNTYTGLTAISGGKLLLGNGGTSGSIVGNVVNNGVLVFNRSDACALGGAVSGTGSVWKLGAGTLTLSGVNSYSGTTAVSAGAITAQSTTALGSGSVSVASGAAVQLQGSGIALVNAMTLRGTGVGAAGVLRNISGANTITGTFAFGSNVQIGVDSGGLTLNGNISGGYSLTKIGAGTLTLIGSNSYTGGTTLSAGWLVYGSATAFGSGVLTLSGGTLCAGAENLAMSNTILVDAGENTYFTIANGTCINTNVYGSLTGSGTLTISGPVSRFYLRGNNSAFSGTFVNQMHGDAVSFRYSNSGSALAHWVLNSNAEATASGTVSLGALSGTNSSAHLSTQNESTTATFAIGALNTSTTYAGRIFNDDDGSADTVTTSRVSIVKVGTGTLTLTGASNYTGGTLLAAGCLAFAGNSAFGSSTLTLSAGTLCGNGGAADATVACPIYVTPGANICLASAGTASINLTGSLTGSGTLTVNAPMVDTIWLRSNLTAFNGTIYIEDVGSHFALQVRYATSTGTGASWVLGGADSRVQFYGGATAAYSMGALSGENADAVINNNSGGTYLSTLSIGALNTSTVYAGHIYDRNAGTSTARIALVKAGTGTLTLSGESLYTGGTTINNGTLQIGAGGAGGSIGGDVLNNARLAFNRSDDYTFGGVVSGTGSVVKLGKGTLILSQTSTYSGSTTVSEGILLAATTASLPGYSASGLVSVSAGAAVGGYVGTSYWTEANFTTLRTKANWTPGAALAIDTSKGSYTYASVINDGGTAGTVSVGLVKLGANMLTLSTTNTYTGTTTVIAGTLAYGVSNAISTGGIAVSGGTLSLGNYSDSVGAVTLDSGAIIGSGTLTSISGFAVSSGTISAVLAGTVGLTKSTTNTVTLSGANVYTGTTYLDAGALVCRGTAAAAAVLASTAMTDIRAGTLVLDYSGNTASGAGIASQVNSILTASYNGGSNSWASGAIHSTLANTNSTNSYALGWTNNTATSAVTVKVVLYGDATMDGTVNIYDLGQVLANYNQSGSWAAGDFNYDGTVNIYDLGKVLANYNKSISLSDVSINPSDYSGLDGQGVGALQAAGVNVVPEPGTLALAGAGAIGLIAYARRRRK
jgi:fibronectin-binding autotransporter adhesin